MKQYSHWDLYDMVIGRDVTVHMYICTVGFNQYVLSLRVESEFIDGGYYYMTVTTSSPERVVLSDLEVANIRASLSLYAMLGVHVFDVDQLDTLNMSNKTNRLMTATEVAKLIDDIRSMGEIVDLRYNDDDYPDAFEDFVENELDWDGS